MNDWIHAIYKSFREQMIEKVTTRESHLVEGHN